MDDLDECPVCGISANVLGDISEHGLLHHIWMEHCPGLSCICGKRADSPSSVEGCYTAWQRHFIANRALCVAKLLLGAQDEI